MPPLVGHSSPPLAIAEELELRGHEVAWAGVAKFHSLFLSARAKFYDCRTGWEDSGPPERPATLMGPGALKFLWEDVFVPLADGSAADLEGAVRDFNPDLLFVDQQALAGSMLAERLGIPWVTSATTMIELINPVGRLPKVLEWRNQLFAGLRERIGDPEASHDPLFSPALTVAFGIGELFGARSEIGSPIEFVGPVFRPPSASAAVIAENEKILRWAQESGPTVLVALGTTNIGAGDRFLRAAAEGLLEAGYRTIIADPNNALAELSDPNLLVAPHVPQQQLLAHVAAFINHGGYNSVCEALWHGVPMVVAGIRDDQPLIAEKTEEYGVGVAVRFSRATSAQIAAATQRVLEEPTFREATKPYAAALRGAGGVTAAVDAIEGVLAQDPISAQKSSLRTGI
ncbi:glycosyltransferase [Psychromicrobium sp. YIM B11713]|uniref:glycosyltransferase n=1 Tax=Psychromicrobium sp. YIM B11713 TaxID=3145233 RepID=UPI00374F495E